jgi:hypothetical protein
MIGPIVIGPRVPMKGHTIIALAAATRAAAALPSSGKNF